MPVDPEETQTAGQGDGPVLPGERPRLPDGEPLAETQTAGLGDRPSVLGAIDGNEGVRAGGPARPGAGHGAALIPGYRIVRELGQGGMGQVYEAIDEKLGRRIALKILAPHLAASDRAGQRFEHEAWIAGRLDHPCLVKVYDRGRSGGVSWFAMQFLDGGSLADVLHALRQNGRDETRGLVFGSRSYVVWVLERILEAARGLDHAHRRGVVHRDVKPVNLLLSREHGTVAVADFGIAFDTDATRLTQTGDVIGTIRYMAPEQILGQRDRIGPWTDVYSLGVTMFELLTLQLPYDAKTQQLYVQEILTGPVRRARTLNARVGSDLETVLLKALEKNPLYRYRSAAELAGDITNVLEFRPIRARRPGWRERAVKWVRRKPVHAALAAVLVLALPGLGLLVQQMTAHYRLAREKTVEEIWREVRWLDEQEGRSAELATRAESLLRLEPRHVPALRSHALALERLAQEAGRSGDRTVAASGDRTVAASGNRTGPATEDSTFRTDLLRRALADVDSIVSAEPGAVWPLRLRARLLSNLGRKEESAATLAEADRRRGTESTDDDLRWEALAAYDEHDPRRAIGLLTRFLARNASAPEETFRRGRARRALGDLEGAIVDFRVAVGLDPEDYFFLVDLGRALTNAQRTDDAQEALSRALQLAPSLNRHQVQEALADNAFARGRNAFAKGDRTAASRFFEEGERAASQAVELAPQSPWAHVDLGVALSERNRLLTNPDPSLVDRAVEHYERARALLEEGGDGRAAPAYAAVLTNLCDAFIQRRRLDRALEACSEGTRSLPDSAPAYYNLAGVQALLGKRDEALGSLERDYALGDRDRAYLEADPWFSSLRGDPRFKALLDRMKEEASKRR